MDTVVGILSDTHGRLPQAAFDALIGVDHIIHAGDICDPAILRELNVLAPVTAVLGNNDFDEYGADVSYHANLEIGGVRFLVAHYPSDVTVGPNGCRALAPGDPLPDICVHGHTHVPRILSGEQAGLAGSLVCPGSIFRCRTQYGPTIARVTIQDARIADVRIEKVTGEVIMHMQR